MAYVFRPRVATSTKEERLAYVRERFTCISDCDQCGICAMFHKLDPETALADYVEGKAEYAEVMMRYR